MDHAELFAQVAETAEDGVENAGDDGFGHAAGVFEDHVQAPTVHVLHADVDVPVGQEGPVETDDVGRGAVVEDLQWEFTS